MVVNPILVLILGAVTGCCKGVGGDLVGASLLAIGLQSSPKRNYFLAASYNGITLGIADFNEAIRLSDAG